MKSLIILNDFVKDIKKTKEMNNFLVKFDAKNSLLILDKNSKEKIFKSIKNIPNVKATDLNHFNAFDIVKYNKDVQFHFYSITRIGLPLTQDSNASII